LRDVLIDPTQPRSLAHAARRRRADMLLEHHPELGSMRVLDLGGEPRFWASIPVRPAQVVCLNLWVAPQVVDWVDQRIGDACDVPAGLRTGWDLVLSNSVIEHVGGHERRRQFAAEVHALAPHHWVQTPNRYFPIEPHFLLPGQQFLPTGLKARAARFAPSRRTADFRRAVEGALQVELLTKTELQHYFPDSRIVHERIAGMSKSLIAVR
jgi:hypothetical protein